MRRTLTDFMPEILQAMRAMWPWEAIAVVLAVAYLLLVIRQNIFCCKTNPIFSE